MAKIPTPDSRKYHSYEHARRAAHYDRMLAELDRLSIAMARRAAIQARPEFENSGGVVVPLLARPRTGRAAAPNRSPDKQWPEKPRPEKLRSDKQRSDKPGQNLEEVRRLLRQRLGR